jgi:hypothetical protein
MIEKITIVEALSAVMADVQAVGKTGTNAQQGYDFRGVDAVVNAVGPALRTHGVIVLPELLESNYATVEVGSKRTLMRECTIRVRYRFVGPAGDDLECTVGGESLDSGDKATAKAHSVAFRTALLQALCIPTDEPDPDEHSFVRSESPSEHADSETVDRLAVELAALSEADLALYSEWRRAHHVPSIKHGVTATQAESISSWLARRPFTPHPEEP